MIRVEYLVKDTMKINENVKIGGKNTTLKDLRDCKDYTSQCAFTNCTLQSGKIMKFGRLVIIQISILPSITNSWANICKVPKPLYPEKTFDNGTPLPGTEFWIYGTGAGNGEGNIRGGIVKDEIKNIVSIYLCGESD